jgi:hypothetical protein
MGAALPSKAERELAELRLIDSFQQHRHCPLHNLIFQHQYGQRSLASVSFGDPHPPRWLRSVFPSHQPPMQVGDSFLKVDGVFGDGHLIDARCRVLA